MERQFCINWPAIVEEAKQRRKAQHLTQSRLAKIAGVSTPSVSHFENKKKDIQLSTVINILTVLGMNDQRHLIFSEHNEHYDFDQAGVIFMGQDHKRMIRCMISREALEDYFKNNEKNLLRVFQANRKRIEHAARRKYLADHIEIDGSILLKTSDFE